MVFQHTAARRRLVLAIQRVIWQPLFQHTAARRRLERIRTDGGGAIMFQHTAARRRLVPRNQSPKSKSNSFNTQPPEGGW